MHILPITIEIVEILHGKSQVGKSLLHGPLVHIKKTTKELEQVLSVMPDSGTFALKMTQFFNAKALSVNRKVI
jgi:hypothetical protein